MPTFTQPDTARHPVLKAGQLISNRKHLVPIKLMKCLADCKEAGCTDIFPEVGNSYTEPKESLGEPRQLSTILEEDQGWQPTKELIGSAGLGQPVHNHTEGGFWDGFPGLKVSPSLQRLLQLYAEAYAFSYSWSGPKKQSQENAWGDV
ncbi:hypothetical protein DSO57_1032816 [Entomophthora muscae]|uniref:Uncharacterized protein n=1 Tax=Entomophthora muscae TaxID=34485 RepID=A0ACC2SPJ2_9FUNG|nr:hypothetical protein DSO57_1032816 [Entomophthora muscae]